MKALNEYDLIITINLLRGGLRHLCKSGFQEGPNGTIDVIMEKGVHIFRI